MFNGDIHDLNIIDNLQGNMDYGEYYAGDEPDDSDSQAGDDEDFECEDEEGEEESDGDEKKQSKQIIDTKTDEN
jgi:hypothetical protein